MEARAFIIENDPGLSAALKKMLGRQGVSCRSADNAREALKEMGSVHWNPDLIILDLDLPLPSGREILAWISIYRPDIPVLIASGSIRYPYLDENPAWALLPKPFGYMQLMRACHQVLPVRFRHPQQRATTPFRRGNGGGGCASEP
jgi:DNA-binding NtrC family response regulator